MVCNYCFDENKENEINSSKENNQTLIKDLENENELSLLTL